MDGDGRRGGGMNGSMLAGWGAVVAGLILLGMCASQWDAGTGATMGRALSAYNGGDRSGLASLGLGSIRQSSQVGVEGLAGLFWLGIGIFLVKKAGAASRPTHYQRPESPRRR